MVIIDRTKKKLSDTTDQSANSLKISITADKIYIPTNIIEMTNFILHAPMLQYYEGYNVYVACGVNHVVWVVFR